MQLVDSHAHLVDERFGIDRHETIERAIQASVVRVLTVSVDRTTSEASLELAKTYSVVEPAFGIHPFHADQFEVQSDSVHEMIKQCAPRAVGEIGLDYFRCAVSRQQQMEAFRTQVLWAVEAGLPVVIHDREAHDEVFTVLEEMRPQGVLHCFSGDAPLLDRALGCDMFIGFAGNVTYKNAAHLKDSVRAVPIERLLIETDCPSLAPQGWRGQRNEPSYVRAVAEEIGSLRGMTPVTVAEITSRNAARLFQW